MDGAQWVVDKTFDGGVLTLGLKEPNLFYSRFCAFPPIVQRTHNGWGTVGLLIKLLTGGC